MGVHSFLKTASVAALAVGGAHAARIIQANDDGWAELYLRSFHDALIDAGHDAVVSAPAENESARSSLDVDPTNRTSACEYNSCSANSGPTGTNATDPRLNWVNSYPATSMRYGISTFGPGVWDGAAPELAVSGPNVGSNVGFIQTEFSGTIGAACYAVDQGIPALAFSGLTSGNLAWDTTPVPARSLVYADLALNLTSAVLAAGAPYLPDGVFLNVNMAEVGEGDDCADASDFRFVLSRINTPSILSSTDVTTSCGGSWLPTEKSVVDAGCYVSVSVGSCSDKTTADATAQQTVLDKLVEQDVRSSEQPSESPSDDDAGLEWSVEEETALRHKMDYRTVPWLTGLYLLCFLDRVNIGNARIQGMQQDLHLEGLRFNWALSIFYIVYLVVEVPSNIILKHVGPRYYLPFLVVGFGLVSLCSAFITSYPGLLVARAILGAFEGGAMPGMAFYLSTFYKREELLFRVGIFVSSASMAGAFGGLLATGLSRIPAWGLAAMRIHTWRNIFFFEGLLTVACGLVAPVWLPASPSTCAFLTDRERAIAAERLRRDQQEAQADDERMTAAHVRRALLCVHTYTCAFGFFLNNITVQGLSVFLPTILRDLGWTDTKAQLYSVPPYVCACVSAISVAYASDKTHRRGLYLAAFALFAITGFALLRWEENPNVRYMAVFFVMAVAFPAGPGFLAWAINNSAGPSVRAVTSGYVVTVGTIGGIVATWTYIPSDAPAYKTGHTINLSGQIGVMTLAIFGILYCTYENKVRAAGKRDHRLDGLSEGEKAQLGYRHPEFRYMV